MRDIATKTDDIGDTLSADDFNSVMVELENAITSTDQTLDAAGGPDTLGLEMLGKSMSNYSVAGGTFTDTGVADAYILSIASNLKSPTKYFDGFTALFKATNTNTGATTVNISAIGAANVTTAAGVALVGGEIVAGSYYTIVYNLGNTRFELVA